MKSPRCWNSLLLLALALASWVAPSARAAGLPTSADAFFDSTHLYYIRVTGWNSEWMFPPALEQPRNVPGAQVEIFAADPASEIHCPDDTAIDATRIYQGTNFSLRVSGNATLGTPKSSHKIKFADGAPFLGMSALNLKSMWNDVSQMREALAWKLFRLMGVPAPRHTYARFCVNGRYYGLYSLIEEIDGALLKDRFKTPAQGNLYKGNWPDFDVGAATLEHRQDATGDDSGKQYFVQASMDARTYRLKSFTKGAGNQTYDDLATFTRALNAGTPGTPEFRRSLEAVFDVHTFLSWAAVNILVGGWDNYWATPSNFFLYNGGPAENPQEFMSKPFFHWIPWDYDNTFGITYLTTTWQYADLLDWAASTKTYYKGLGVAHIPLITRVLQDSTYRAEYLSQIRVVLDRYFTPEWIDQQVATLWPTIEKSIYLESDTAMGPAHTGRQFTNDQVFRCSNQQEFLQISNMRFFGIRDFVVTRAKTARDQLNSLTSRNPTP